MDDKMIIINSLIDKSVIVIDCTHNNMYFNNRILINMINRNDN